MKKLLMLLLVSVSILITVGCGNDSTNNATENSTDSNTTIEEVTYPLTISHAYGDTIIEAKPERVVTLAFGNQDVALALGVVPVGFSAANYGVQDDSGLLPWTKEKLEELGESNPNVFNDTDGFDYEAISAASPDIIIAPYSGLTQEEYDLLSEIAPVIAYPENAWTISWRDWISTTALALGVPEKGTELIASMEAKIAEIKTSHPEFDGKDFVWITFNEVDLSKLHAYSPEDSRVSFLYELGFSYPESIQNYLEEGTYSLSLSSENSDILYDADFLIGYSSEEAYAAAKADSVLKDIPALVNDAVVSIENGTPLSAAMTMTPLSFDYTIDEYIEKIAEAVANVNVE